MAAAQLCYSQLQAYRALYKTQLYCTFCTSTEHLADTEKVCSCEIFHAVQLHGEPSTICRT